MRGSDNEVTEIEVRVNHAQTVQVIVSATFDMGWE